MSRAPNHLDYIAPCPLLPLPERPLASDATRRFGSDRGSEFYLAALEYAQSLWLQGFPARSLLLINRALGADLDARDPVLRQWELPYAAAGWVMQNRAEDQFIGNPRRHYQHLATRMVAPRKELRTWRAWACWSMARRIFPDHPADEKQIAEEGVVEPAIDAIAVQLNRLGMPGESDLWRQAMDRCGPTWFGPPRY